MNASFNSSSGRITIEGDTGDNVIRILEAEGNDYVSIHTDGQDINGVSEEGYLLDGSNSVYASDVYEISVVGDDGNDTVDVGPIHGGMLDNFDSVSLVHILGEDGDDQLLGTYVTSDSMIGGEGDDSIYGHHGNDTIRGGAGQDSLSGNNGNDSILGEDDEDWIHGNLGNDTLHGGDDEDSIEGNAGADSIAGGESDALEDAEHLWHDDDAGGTSADGSSDTIWGGEFGQSESEVITASEEEAPTPADWVNGEQL